MPMLAVLLKNSESAGWEPDGWEKRKHNDKQKITKKSRCAGRQNSIKENMIQNALWREYTYCRIKKYIREKSYYSLSPSDLILDLLSFCSQEDICPDLCRESGCQLAQHLSKSPNFIFADPGSISHLHL